MPLQDILIRVYGIYINRRNEVLLSDESYSGINFTKFPGGGLEKGEGTKECIIREFKEELEIDVEIKDHFYTTDFFQPSAFNPNQQIISIYYIIHANDEELKKSIKIANKNNSNDQFFKWVSLSEFTSDDVTFPIDKKVTELLIKKQHLSDV